MSKSATAGLIAGAALLLMLPALWNGFPFLFWDSGDYLTVALTGERVVYRDPVYGFVSAPLHAGVGLWGIAAGQCLLAAWVLWETVRLLQPRPGREGTYLSLVALLGFGSSLPWFAGQIMPDIMGASGGSLDIPPGDRSLATASVSGLRCCWRRPWPAISVSCHWAWGFSWCC